MMMHFNSQAESLIKGIQEQQLSVDDVAKGLMCLYTAGVVDAVLYSETEKKEMYNTIKQIYKTAERNIL